MIDNVMPNESGEDMMVNKDRTSQTKNHLNVSKTWCILPWIHLSTRPDASMLYCQC